MYLVGAAHPNKMLAQRLLEESIVGERRLVTDSEVLQEILHRYSAINRRDAIQPAFEAILGVVDEVFAVALEDVSRAKDILIGAQYISARDALHLAVMERQGIHSIMSFDTGFDGYPGIARIGGL